MNRELLKLEVVRRYYLDNTGQAQIARELGISRSYASKLLVEARQEKLVEIKIRKPLLRETGRELELKEKYGLDRVVVVPVVDGEGDASRDSLLRRLGRAQNDCINSVLRDGDTIGVAWGNTLYNTSLHLRAAREYTGLRVVQICGGVTQVENSTYANEIALNCARAFGAKPYLLPLPALVENSQFRRVFLNEPSIHDIMEIVDRVNVAVFTVGQFGPGNSLVRSGYIDEADVPEMLQKGAVGDICTHVINREGSAYSKGLEDRTIAMTLRKLQRVENRIVTAMGRERLQPLAAALRAGYLSMLIVDEQLAGELLDYHNNQWEEEE